MTSSPECFRAEVRSYTSMYIVVQASRCGNAQTRGGGHSATRKAPSVCAARHGFSKPQPITNICQLRDPCSTYRGFKLTKLTFVVPCMASIRYTVHTVDAL